MGCVTVTTDSNGIVKESPQSTNLIRMVDSKIANGQPITSNDVIKNLKDSFVIRRGATTKVEDKSGLSKNLHDIMLLNGIFMLNYGAKKPLLNVTAKFVGNTNKPIESHLGTPANPAYEYTVGINPEVLSQLGTKRAFTHADHNINYEFNYNKINESKISYSPIQQQLIENQTVESNIPIGFKERILEQYGAKVFAEAAILNNFTEENLKSIYTRLNNTNESKPLSDTEKRMEFQSAKDQIEKLQSVFNAAGIPVKVVVDPALEAKGDVTKGADGQITLRINPLKMTEDTHVHEFSHILIELLGEDNPVVKRAIEELKDTQLYELVQSKYPELSGARLDFEVLATAMGLEGAKFNRKNPSKIQVIVNRILRAIKEFFNILKYIIVQNVIFLRYYLIKNTAFV